MIFVYYRTFGKNHKEFATIRNLHRIEKGLSYSNRRKSFGLSYINETTKDSFQLPNEKFIWASKILTEYFRVCKSDDQRFLVAKEYFNTHGAIKDYRLAKPGLIEDAGLDAVKILTGRRSVRGYKKITIDDSLVFEMVDMALNMTPSACNRHAIEVININSAEKRNAVLKLTQGTKGWDSEIHNLMVITSNFKYFKSRYDVKLPIIDGALFSMSFVHTLTLYGLHSCVINWPERPIESKLLRGILDVDKASIIVCLISFGYWDESTLSPTSKKFSRHIYKSV